MLIGCNMLILICTPTEKEWETITVSLSLKIKGQFISAVQMHSSQHISQIDGRMEQTFAYIINQAWGTKGVSGRV